MVDRAAGKIAANGHADHHRATERAIRSPPQDTHFVPHLVHGRPDVVEELDLDDRLQPPRRHADGASNNIGLGQGRIEDAITAVFRLQANGQLEHTAFALQVALREIFHPAGIRNVLRRKTRMRGSRAISSFRQ